MATNPWDNDPVMDAAPAKKSSWDKKQPLSSLTPTQRKDSLAALQKSDALMNDGLKRLTPPQRKKALANYYASPVVQRLRQEAGLPAVKTREDELQTIARKQFERESTRTVKVVRGTKQDDGILARIGSFFERRRPATAEEKQQLANAKPGDTVRVRDNMDLEAASTNAFGRALFGLPERAIAAVENTPGTRNYSERLQVRRAVTDMQRKRSTTGDVIGTVAGSVTGGVGANAAVRGAGRALTAVGATRAGNAVQALTALEQGQRGRNAAKIILGGAAGGAAQSAGEGSDVTTGATVGALAAPAVIAGVKGAEWVSRPVRDFLRLSSAKNILGREISMTAEELTAAADRFRQRTGREPTVFEILPSADRQAVTQMVKRMPSASRERVTEAVRTRVGNMPGELAGRTAELTGGQQRFIAQNIARDLAASRGATRATPEEIALAQRATRDPTELEQVRRDVNRNIMGPYDNQQAYESVNDLLPTTPVNLGNGRIGYEITDDQMASTIRSAAGSLRLRDNIRVQDVTRLLSRLRTTAERGGVEGDAAQNALNHIEDIMARDHPDVADAMARMNAAYAERSRMLEAVQEGRATRLRENVPVTTGEQARGVRQAYDTPEGAAGRAVGQRAEIMSDFGGTPNQAISRAAQIAEGADVQEALRRNLGAQAGQGIEDAAATQAESLRRLSALRQPVKGEEGNTDFGDLAMSMSLLSPTSLIRTKSQAVGTLLRMISGIPEARANQLVDALFSQDPRQMASATRLLTSAGEQAQSALRDIVASIAIGGQTGASVAGVDATRDAADGGALDNGDIGNPAPVSDVPEPSAEEPWANDQEQAADVPYGHAVISAIFPEAEITDDNRDPNSDLGRKNPGSFHNRTDGAVDLRPIPGMTFDEFIATLEAEGVTVIEAIDEVNHPSGHATGPHWHVVVA